VKRRGAWLLLGAGVTVLLLVSPLALRQAAFFRIRRVEVVGARYLAPERIVEALGLATEQNLFDPVGDAEQRVAAVPGIVRVDIGRRVPGTLRVTVVEREPVGLAPERTGLVPIDCDAAALPYDPARSGLALPIVEAADSVLARALCVVRAADSALYAAVQGVRGGPGGSVMLELGDQRVQLNGTPSTADVEAVALVRRHLEESGRAFAELDGRYRGLVYARGRRS
jgi:cell division protein FtsQ